MPAKIPTAGTRVKITGMQFVEEDPSASVYLGEKGIVVESDAYMSQVFLDKYQEDGPLHFLHDEVEIIPPLYMMEEGGELKKVYTPITPQYILGRKDLSVYEKLVYFIIHHENPADYEIICEYASTTMKFAEVIVKKLVGEGLVLPSKTQGNIFFCNYQLRPDDVKKKKEKETKTVITEQDKDILLFIQALERFYHQSGVNYPISKNGKKHITKAVYFLDGMWKKKKEKPELEQFELKDDLYTTYIEYVFDKVHKSDLNQLKRLKYSGSKRGFMNWLEKPTWRFEPYLIDKKFDDNMFYGVNKKDIPKDVEKSGYWSTFRIFLGSRYKSGSYPVAKQVLFALEMCIIFMLFRKQKISGIDSAQLINIHGKYVDEYKRAKAASKLDDLGEFVKENKLNSNVCNDCTKKTTCPTFKSAAIVVNCSQKKVKNGD
jgi:hypothetical protein